MSALILGDVHIGKGINIGKAGVGSALNSRVSDQLEILNWTLDQSEELGIDNIIITGDIFEDPKPHPQIITLFISWLKKCQSMKVNIHIIAGNHDILRVGNVYLSPLDIITECDMEFIHVYKNIDTIIINNCAYTFMPFRDRKSFNCESNTEALKLLADSLQYELASIPLTYKKIVVGHLAIEGSIPVGDEIDDMTNELFCPTSMFNGYDCVWMGHVHKFQIMQKATDVNPYVAHIGSMDISNFSESDQGKKISVINPLNDNLFEYIKIPTRNLKKISIVVPDDIEDQTQYILSKIDEVSGLDKSMVSIDIELSDCKNKVNKHDIEKHLTSKGVYNVSAFSESKKINLVKKEGANSINNKLDTISAMKKYSELFIDPTKQNDFISLSLEIYSIYKLESNS